LPGLTGSSGSRLRSGWIAKKASQPEFKEKAQSKDCAFFVFKVYFERSVREIKAVPSFDIYKIAANRCLHRENTDKLAERMVRARASVFAGSLLACDLNAAFFNRRIRK
jgi:hypothetical protein